MLNIINYELTVKLNDESNIDESSINEEEFNQHEEFNNELNSENKKDFSNLKVSIKIKFFVRT